MNPVENTPDLWRALLPVKKEDGHKYNAGHAVIYAAPELTGASRLAATACARIGTGLVTLLAPEDVANVYRAALPAAIVVRCGLRWYADNVSARLYGPGGMSVVPDLASDLPTILDADALHALPDNLPVNVTLTPHDGEFARLFPELTGSSIQRACTAAQLTQAHIVLKGRETVITAPNGKTVINRHASPHLATAGTGDVLAGMITGLAAQKMPPFEAACAAVWIHGECARRFGRGLIADDLPDLIPQVLKSLHEDTP